MRLDFKSMIISYFMFLVMFSFFASFFAQTGILPTPPNLNSMFYSINNAYVIAIGYLGGEWVITIFGYVVSLVFLENMLAYSLFLIILEIYSFLTFIVNVIAYFGLLLKASFVLLPYPLNYIFQTLAVGSLMIAFITSIRVLQTSLSW